MIDRHRPNNVHSNIPLVACLAGVFIREVYLSPMIFSLCSKSPQGWCDAELILSSVDDFSSGTVFYTFIFAIHGRDFLSFEAANRAFAAAKPSLIKTRPLHDILLASELTP